MNQDQVKAKLLQLNSAVPEFQVVFTGKESKKVDGLYKPETQEILIHNENHEDDNAIMYTAIHEFAHHVHFSRSDSPKTTRAHTIAYWSIFHELLELAEKKNIYHSMYDKIPEIQKLTEEIKTKFLSKNGELMSRLGELLLQAFQLCQKYKISFEDYLDRHLGVQKSTARSIMQVSQMNINPSIGFENMKTIARIKDDEDRKKAEKELLSGKSPDQIKHEYRTVSAPKEDLKSLEREKDRIMKQIQNLKLKLVDLEMKLDEIQEVGGYQ